MPAKARSKSTAKAQKANAKKEKQLLEARIKSCHEKCTEAREFLEPSSRNTESNFVKAKTSLDAAVESYDANPLPYFLLGQWYRMQGMITEAIENYSHALDLDPTNVPALEWRGSCYQTQRDYAHAIEDNTSIITLDPENGHAYNMRGLCVLHNCVPGLRLRCADFESCVRDFSAAVRLNEANYYAVANLGKAYEVQGQYDKAVECYGRALRINEDYTYAKLRRGCTALRMAEAVTLLRDTSNEETADGAGSPGEVGSATRSLVASSSGARETALPSSGTSNTNAAHIGATSLDEVSVDVKKQLEQEHLARATADLLRIAENDFMSLLDPNPETNRAAADVTIVLNIGICALLRKDVKKAEEYLKWAQEIVTKRPAMVADGEAAPIENPDTVARVLSIRLEELRRERGNIRSSAA